MDQIKCFFYNTLSFEFHCCSCMWLIQEIVKLGYQQAGDLGFWFCKPHASWKRHSKFKGKQLPQRTQIANLRPHSELAEDSRIKLYSRSPTYDNYAIVWLLGIGIWRYFISGVKTMRIKVITAYGGPAGYEMQASFLGSIDAHNAHCPFSNCLGAQGS